MGSGEVGFRADRMYGSGALGFVGFTGILGSRVAVHPKPPKIG